MEGFGMDEDVMEAPPASQGRLHACVCVCEQKKEKNGSSVRDVVAAQMSPATDGSAVHTGLMDRWFVSSRKVNRSVLPHRRAEAGRLESHVSGFYSTDVRQPHHEQTEKAVLRNELRVLVLPEPRGCCAAETSWPTASRF